MKQRPDSFDAVVRALQAGKPAIFPTDTVVGLGVAVDFCPDPHVLFDLKRRPAGKPVAWLVDSPRALERYGADVGREARELVGERWPGALTVIVKASASVPCAYRSESGTIGLRMPGSELVRALIAAVGCPVATTSANFSGEEPPRSVDAVDPALRRAAVVLDAADQGSGTASSVVDFTQPSPRVLR